MVPGRPKRKAIRRRAFAYPASLPYNLLTYSRDPVADRGPDAVGLVGGPPWG
jgi:hypothetical protein